MGTSSDKRTAGLFVMSYRGLVMFRLHAGWRIMIITVIVCSAFIACTLQPGQDSLVSQKTTSHKTNRELMADCLNCHSNKTPSLDPLLINGKGTAGKHIAHVSDKNIPCIKCHSGYVDQKTHMDGILETGSSLVHFDTANPGGKWIGDTGPDTGSCASLNCHGGETLAWFGTETWTLPACNVCHTSKVGTRREVMGTKGDFGADTALASHHVAGSGDPAESQCLVCHDLSGHTSGVVVLKNADTGAGVQYNPSDPSTLEPFCLSCHDADGALTEGANAKSPFSDGRTLGVIPNEAGDKIAGYWNSSDNVHKDTGGLTCAGTGAKGTGCHGNDGTINMHGSVSKGLLAKNLTLPIPAYSPYDYNDFELCFSCHENYPSVSKEVVLGYKEGGNYDVWWAPTPYYTAEINSLFRDRYIGNSADYPDYWNGVDQPYNDNPIWGDSYTPLHNYHLLSGDHMMQNVWNYRGSGETGRASCVTCHNVHGTSGTVRSTYEEFGITPGTGLGPDRYKSLVNYDVLGSYPINCNIDCHGIAGPSSYWDIPSGE